MLNKMNNTFITTKCIPVGEILQSVLLACLQMIGMLHLSIVWVVQHKKHKEKQGYFTDRNHANKLIYK
jgi:hypothetical protein